MLNNPRNHSQTIIINDQEYCYKALYEQALKMGQWFINNRVTCLAFCLPNSLTNLLAYLGAWFIDIDIMPINPRLKAPELLRLVEQHQPSHLWVLNDKYTSEFITQCKQLNIELICLEQLPHNTGILEKPINNPQSKMVQFSSGTTGEYKGVVHSYAQCHNYAKLIAKDMRYTTQDRLLICLSINHAMAFSYQLLPALYLELSFVMMHSFDADKALELIESQHITSTALLPTFAYWLAKKALALNKKIPHLKKIFIAGDALPQAMRETIIKAFGIEPVIGIGMTECFGYCLNFDPQNKPGSAGKPVADFNIRIKADEIQIKGPALLTHYNNATTLNETAFDQDWFKTGDLGAIDNDGYLWFHGRKKDIIISAGSNIAPLEIESAIYQHPDVLEAVVTSMPDTDLIEMVIAYITLTKQSELSEQAMIEFLKVRIADYKLPKKIFFLASLPKNATGKLDRHALALKAQSEYA